MNNEEDNKISVVVPTISLLMADNIKYKINNKILRQKLTELQKVVDELKKEVANFKKFELK